MNIIWTYQNPVFALLLQTLLYMVIKCEESDTRDRDVTFCDFEDCGSGLGLDERRKYFSGDHLKDILDNLSLKQIQDLIQALKDKALTIDEVFDDLHSGFQTSKSAADDRVNIDTENGDIGADNSKESLVKTLRDILEANGEFEQENHQEETLEYEFPKLSRITPGKVGDVVEIELYNGHTLRRITRSVLPPIFEIPNFLSDEECSQIIDSALNTGLNVSNLFGSEINDEFDENLDLSEISRVSDQTWLREENVGTTFWNVLQHRLSKLTELPLGIIQRGEPIQVVSYMKGGHYHAHLDTTEHADHLPCCFQTRCGDKELTPQWAQCCRLCRYITVLYYLNDPEEGGETAFPLADMPEELVDEKFINVAEQEWYNLSRYCHNSSMVVKPKRGTAIMWYSHFVDEQTGYLGPVDRRSHHGGCDLVKGTKWIANNWISSPTYQDRFKPGVFYKGP